MDDQSNLTSPQITKTAFTNNQYFEIIKNYKDFNTRTGRKDYWFFILINFIISVVVSFLWWPLAIIFQLLIFYPTLAISSRRLHDVNKDFLYFFIPGYNIILLLKRGTSFNSPNIYGSTVESKIKIQLLYVLVSALLVLFVGRTIFAQQQIKRQRQNKIINVPDNTETSKEEIKISNNHALQEVQQAQTLEEIIKAYQNARKGSQASLEGAMKWISLCQTSQQIKEANNNFPENSEASIAALKKWKELSQKELDQAKTIEELKTIYENAPNDNTLKSIIYNRWNEISLQLVEQIQTISEAKTAYNNSPKSSQAKTEILKKWKELVGQKIGQAQSFEDVKNIYNNLPDDNDLKSQTITKWISISLNTSQIKEVYSSTTNRNDQMLALQKWKELANQEVSQAQTSQDINDIYNNLPDDSRIKNTAITKWVSLCETYQEAREAYSSISSDYSDGKQLALDKWNSLALDAIERAQTLDAVKEIYNNTPDNSSSRKTAIEKIKELS